MTTCFLQDGALPLSYKLGPMVHDVIKQAREAAVPGAANVETDIPDELAIYSNEAHVRRILKHVLTQIIREAGAGQTRICAKTYSEVVLIHIRLSSELQESDIRPALLDMQPWVMELGGFLDITSQRTTETTIAFSFLNSGDQPDHLN